MTTLRNEQNQKQHTTFQT